MPFPSSPSNGDVYKGWTYNSTTGAWVHSEDKVDNIPWLLAYHDIPVNKETGYFVDTNSSEIILTLPASPTTGDTFWLLDQENTFSTNNCVLDPNGNKIDSSADNFIIDTFGLYNVVYVDSSVGWVINKVDAFDNPPLPAFQGSNSGYTSGGNTSSNTIDKFSFVSNGNATDVGNLTVGRQQLAGQSSSTYGYSSGGGNIIDKFLFASDGNAIDVGDLTASRSYVCGQFSDANGYTSAGNYSNVIDKFSFTSDGNATDVGDLTAARYAPAGVSSSEYGYTVGGDNTGGADNIIDKFLFASDGNATSVGNLASNTMYGNSGASSMTHGYSVGGWGPTVSGPSCNIIEKFLFSSDGNAVDVGDLTVVKRAHAGQSSTTYGYSSGGYVSSATNIIDKFNFSSDGNATDVGDLTVSRYFCAGQQN